MSDSPEDGYMLQVFIRGTWTDWWSSPVPLQMVRSLGGVEEVMRVHRNGPSGITEPMRVVRWTAETVAELR